MIVTVTGFEFDNGQKWTIPEDDRIPYQSLFSDHMWEPTPPPEPEQPEDSEGDDDDNYSDKVINEGGVG